MKICLERGSHSVGQYAFHVILVVAYRRDIFRDERVLRLTKAYLESKAEQMKIRIGAMEFGPDHVHIFTDKCGRWSGFELKRQLKGFSSYMMRKNHRKLFRHKLWGEKFWKTGDFCRSVGSVTAENVEFYVTHCQQKHWEMN